MPVWLDSSAAGHERTIMSSRAPGNDLYNIEIDRVPAVDRFPLTSRARHLNRSLLTKGGCQCVSVH